MDRSVGQKTVKLQFKGGEEIGGRYVIEKFLDHGGMGTVYLAWDKNLSRKVVVKFPDPTQFEDPGFATRFAREVESLSLLEHPHIIKIIDANQHADLPYVVVQYANGGDLNAAIRGRKVKPVDTLKWFKEIAEALDFVHQNSRVHRDVKPANIFLDSSGHFYLSDFGIATIIEQESDTALTGVGQVIGSTAFLPPEAITRTLTPAFDQYSLAVTLYLALCGELPFDAETEYEALIVKSQQDPKPLLKNVASLPRESSAAVIRALSRDPKLRFASCTDFYNAFVGGIKNARSLRRNAVVVGVVTLLVAATALVSRQQDSDIWAV